VILTRSVLELFYKLHDFTPEEMDLVEKATPAPTMTKPLLQEKVFPDLKRIGEFIYQVQNNIFSGDSI